MLIKVDTNTNEIIKYPYSKKELKEENPNTSFPKNDSDIYIPELGIFYVYEGEVPTFNEMTHKMERMQPIYENGVWIVKYEVLPLTQNELLVKHQELQNVITNGVMKRLDDFAKTRNYGSIMSACTYATSTILKFQQEGQRAVELRDQTWTACYQILDDIQNGVLPIPNSYEDIEQYLPDLTWNN